MVFVDEVHRFNKAQQDAFLPHVESGLFTFIGATTENPSFEVNSALLSRATVHVLQPLDDDDLRRVLARGRGLLRRAALTERRAQRLIGYADGDARRLLNTLETVARVGGAARARSTRRRSSVRSASSCAATTRAASSSTTPSRRCTSRCAAPTPTPRCTGSCACSTAASTRATPRGAWCAWRARTSAWPTRARCAWRSTRAETYERLGSPEGELALAQAVVYLAVAPKSNAVYTAYKAARAFVAQDGTRPVPLHLRNAPTALMKDSTTARATAMRTTRRAASPPASTTARRTAPAALLRAAPRGLEIRIAREARRIAPAERAGDETRPRRE